MLYLPWGQWELDSKIPQAQMKIEVLTSDV